MRGYNEGTIGRPRKDGLIPVAVTMWDGARKWKYGRSKPKAQHKLKELLQLRDAGLDVHQQRLTLAEWLHSWLNGLADSPRHPQTLRG